MLPFNLPGWGAVASVYMQVLREKNEKKEFSGKGGGKQKNYIDSWIARKGPRSLIPIRNT
jgi:hypothetical protein